MSDWRAIAAATATLRYLLWDAIQVVPGARFTTLRPDAVGKDHAARGVNAYLYQVVPNAALRNEDLPTRRGDGRLVRRSVAAVDLHYLFSFYGDDKLLEPQLLLGRTLSVLEERPTPTRQMIVEALTAAPEGVAPSDLARQVEALRFTFVPLGLEAISKFWSVFFQVPYALSAAWQCSVVMLDGPGIPAPALPVERVNRPILAGLDPQLVRVSPAKASVGTTLSLEVSGLQSDGVHVRLGRAQVPATTQASGQVTLDLASDPLRRAGVGPGITRIALVDRSGAVSNALPFSLAPALDPGHPARFEPDADSLTADQRAGTVHVRVHPPVQAGQEVTLRLNGLGSGHPGYEFPASGPPVHASDLTFAVSDLVPGRYLIRVRVDGVDSALDYGGDHFTGPRLVIQ